MMSANWELETEKFIFFWGGVFSNWYISDIEVALSPTQEKSTFNCVEQYMMVKKASLFSDEEAVKAILSTSQPSSQKAIGRSVKGYSDAVWDPVARSTVYPAIYAKFTQNGHLNNLLLTTGDKVIVEASPTDKKWGIGLGITTDSNIDNVSSWRGKNWLGQIIIKVRTDIRNGVDNSFKDIQWSNDPTQF
jgi:ribA/ribD-fused uncharacterized protein